jgi:hypothetical protein
MKTLPRFLIIFFSIFLLTIIGTFIAQRTSVQQDRERVQKLRTEQAATLPPGTEPLPYDPGVSGARAYAWRYSLGAPTFLSFKSGQVESATKYWPEYFKIGEFLFNILWMATVAALLTLITRRRSRNEKRIGRSVER